MKDSTQLLACLMSALIVVGLLSGVCNGYKSFVRSARRSDLSIAFEADACDASSSATKLSPTPSGQGGGSSSREPVPLSILRGETKSDIETDINDNMSSSSVSGSTVKSPSFNAASNLSGGGFFGRPRSVVHGAGKATTVLDAKGDSRTNAVSQKRVAVHFGVMYLCAITYSVINTRTIGAFEMGITVTAAQMVTGSMISLVLCLGRVLDRRDVVGAFSGLPNIAACRLIADVTNQVCLEVDVTSCLLLGKAVEPLVTAAFSALQFGWKSSPLAYASLAPVVIGTALASAARLEANWATIFVAAASVIASAETTVLAKRQLTLHDAGVRNNDKVKSMSPAVLNAAVTIMSALVLVPLAAVLEWPDIENLWSQICASPPLGRFLLKNAVFGGIAFYVYTEMSFRVLQVLSPVAHAVAVDMSTSVINAGLAIAYHVKLSKESIVGSAVASGGAALFSRATSHFTPSTVTTSTNTENTPKDMPANKTEQQSRASSRGPHKDDNAQGVGPSDWGSRGGRWMGWREVARKAKIVSSKRRGGASGGVSGR